MANHAVRDRDSRRLRDQLTIERLHAAVAQLADADVIGYDGNWWDGQTHDPCLLVRYGAGRDRLRVVETAGACVVLPFDRRSASRELARRRAPRRPELGIIRPRRPLDDATFDATVDVVRCSGDGCGALRPLDAVGPCPRCGLDIPRL
ncbi:MAG TPA: hypothetical protein VG708_03965 [Mycobacteriales bacterium]|nr:hypothetical protein [Mycobacteriales bacterium]